MAFYSYSSKFDQFLEKNDDEILGIIVNSYNGEVQPTQKRSLEY